MAVLLMIARAGIVLSVQGRRLAAKKRLYIAACYAIKCPSALHLLTGGRAGRRNSLGGLAVWMSERMDR